MTKLSTNSDESDNTIKSNDLTKIGIVSVLLILSKLCYGQWHCTGCEKKKPGQKPQGDQFKLLGKIRICAAECTGKNRDLPYCEFSWNSIILGGCKCSFEQCIFIHPVILKNRY